MDAGRILVKCLPRLVELCAGKSTIRTKFKVHCDELNWRKNFIPS